MSTFSQVTLMGNLTRDPELKYSQNGNAICNLSLAINEYAGKDADGNVKEDVCYVDVTAFGERGEAIAKFFTKGQPIIIIGSLKLDRWTQEDGTNRQKHWVRCDKWVFPPKGNADDTPRRAAEPRQSNPRRPAPQPEPVAAEVDPVNVDDIPFS